MATTVAPLNLEGFDASNHDWVLLDEDSSMTSDELAEGLRHDMASLIQRAERARAKRASQRRELLAHTIGNRVTHRASRTREINLSSFIAAALATACAFAGQGNAFHSKARIELLASPQPDTKSHALVPYGRLSSPPGKNEHNAIVIPHFQPPIELPWEVSNHVMAGMLLVAIALQSLSGKKPPKPASEFGPEEDDGATPTPSPLPSVMFPSALMKAKPVPRPRARLNPWNDFQHCVGGCNLDRKSISNLYLHLKEAATISAPLAPNFLERAPRDLLVSSARTWDGFCVSVSGCGLDQKKTAKLYQKLKAMDA